MVRSDDVADDSERSDGSDGSDGPSGTAIPCDPLFETSTGSKTLLGVEEHRERIRRGRRRRSRRPADRRARADGRAGREVPEVPAPSCAIARARRTSTFPAQYMFKDVPEFEDLRRSGRTLARARWTCSASRVGMLERRPRTSKRAGARSQRAPDRFFGSCDVDPNRGMEAVRELEQAVEQLGVKAAQVFPAGLTPAGADQRQEVVSALREVRGARHPDLRVRGRARAAGADGVPGRRAHRRGVLVLPRAEVRDAPRLRAVDRPRGEADAQVAEPLLLDVARSRRSTTRRTSSTSRTRAAPTRSCTRATSRWASSLERIFKEMPDVPFRDHVWPKFLRENATAALRDAIA